MTRTSARTRTRPTQHCLLADTKEEDVLHHIKQVYDVGEWNVRQDEHQCSPKGTPRHWRKGNDQCNYQANDPWSTLISDIQDPQGSHQQEGQRAVQLKGTQQVEGLQQVGRLEQVHRVRQIKDQQAEEIQERQRPTEGRRLPQHARAKKTGKDSDNESTHSNQSRSSSKSTQAAKRGRSSSVGAAKKKERKKWVPILAIILYIYHRQ